MSIEHGILTETYLAAEDLSSDQFRFVRLNASDPDKVERPNAANDKIIGVLQNAPAAGEEAVVMEIGRSKIQAAGAIAIDAWVTAQYVSATDAGKALTTTTDKDVVSGQCVKPAGAEDDLAEIIITRFTLSAA
jgi:hypothetical protein